MLYTMNSAHLYLPTLLPQWGIFAGVVLLTVGFVEKKLIWTKLGWIILIITGIAALYFNLFGEFNTLPENAGGDPVASMLVTTGWQAVAGGALAAFSLIMLQLKKKRYRLLAILTLIYFILIFFLYSQVSDSSAKRVKTVPQSEQQQQ
jgi:hypothetical protein